MFARLVRAALSVRATIYDAPTCRCGRQADRQAGIGIRATTVRVKPTGVCVVHGVRTTGDREIDSYVGPLLANRIPTARQAAAAPARVRKNKESPGNVASQKSILVHRLRRGFETSV